MPAILAPLSEARTLREMSSPDPGADPLAEATRRLEAGEEVVLATAIRTDGAPPCRPGQKLLLGPNGPLAGTLGCSEFDASAVDETKDRLAAGEPALRTFTHDLGSVEVYLEPLRPRPRLVVLGATPVAEHLLRGGAELGYATVLVESRTERLTPGHEAAAGKVVASVVEVPGLGAGVDAVHTDHDAPDIVSELAPLLQAGVRFVGVMGSARHTAPHLEALRAAGCTDDELAQLRTPVGLDLGARTPAEIALSILAGLLAARTGRTGGWLDKR
ncbi:MAG TPA: XdhC/CoxI family protein [Acidimicrobiia bacterium]|nr:XdhC/CoxI family protein [Acidimicrobiia bacterium]